MEIAGRSKERSHVFRFCFPPVFLEFGSLALSPCKMAISFRQRAKALILCHICLPSLAISFVALLWSLWPCHKKQKIIRWPCSWNLLLDTALGLHSLQNVIFSFFSSFIIVGYFWRAHCPSKLQFKQHLLLATCLPWILPVDLQTGGWHHPDLNATAACVERNGATFYTAESEDCQLLHHWSVVAIPKKLLLSRRLQLSNRKQRKWWQNYSSREICFDKEEHFVLVL